MRHVQFDPATLKTLKLRRLFAIQCQAWRQSGLSDNAFETPLTPADLARLQSRATGSLSRPRLA
ncbi:hypothetical protein SAMN05421853_103169 [Roseivivax halotolerans]|uniref:Uncharacterized protein n=1 Tax=Roseivivax halotolerans TaxID=93684 RepID=A0A1I5X762_9RHOB|nr:hypothetical protein [Roseivivax halotolerans]SFQ27487.1 hypothetical protein SAMN05421853_103169 [Roseivivax halotolerans]